MGRYISWADVAGRYPELGANPRKDATQVDSNFVMYAEAQIDGRLASGFTVPFSSNNLTAKDLAIDLTYAMTFRFKDQKKAKEIQDSVDTRIKELLDGKASMVTTSVDLITSTGQSVYSTTQDYHPVFGMSGPLTWQVDSSTIINEEADRGRFI